MITRFSDSSLQTASLVGCPLDPHVSHVRVRVRVGMLLCPLLMVQSYLSSAGSSEELDSHHAGETSIWTTKVLDESKKAQESEC